MIVPANGVRPIMTERFLPWPGIRIRNILL